MIPIQAVLYRRPLNDGRMKEILKKVTRDMDANEITAMIMTKRMKIVVKSHFVKKVRF